MSAITFTLIAIALIFVAISVYFYLGLSRLRKNYSGIIDVQAEADRLKQQTNSYVEKLKADANAELERSNAENKRLTQERETFLANSAQKMQTLTIEYEKAKAVYDRLMGEVSVLEENLEDISFGLYKPHFTYATPEEYKQKLEDLRDQQKAMIRNGTAARFATSWSVGGSLKEGERMQKQYIKLMLRAFNAECDAALTKVSWNNIAKMEERIQKGFDAINQLGGVMQVSITQAYLQLRIDELRMEYEFEEKKHAIAEEQRRIKEQMREQEQAQRELERAQQDAETEEVRFQRALDKAKVELTKSQGEEHRRLTERLKELEQQVLEAHQKKERVKAMAELTRCGYLYIISNVGSFGQDVFKIGMTRRLDPMDRVKELGDASVPFPFDVHAMIYCEDAPSLECEIQTRFADRSVNLVNERKEFFSVTVDELDKWAKEKGLSMYFTRLAEAREYRETMAKRTAAVTRKNTPQPKQSSFPNSLT